MDPIEKRELKRKAWLRLAAQRRRAGLLRGRVVALSLVCFALLWGIVFVQMATGNDPALSGKKKATTGRTTASAEARQHRHRSATAVEPEREVEAEVESEEVEAQPEAEALGPEAEFEEVEAAPEVEEAEPEFVEEPLVTSQS